MSVIGTRSESDSPSIALLLTGNELMTGDIVDSNSAWIAQTLLEYGWPISYKVTVGDQLETLVEQIRSLHAHYDIVIVNGGLGPTVDDLTAEALGVAMSEPLEEHPQARAHLEDFAEKRAIQLSAANLKQALLPRGSFVLANPVGTAVGFGVKSGTGNVYCTPGVPHELKRMLVDQIIPDIQQDFPCNRQPRRIRMRVFGYGESGLQQLLSEAFPDWPESIDIGFRASMPMLELKLQIADASDSSLLDCWAEKVRELLGPHLVTEDQRDLAKVLGDVLQEKSLQFTCAESCTGGMVASQMTRVAGISSVFEAGFVTYSNRMKTAMLGVSETMLERHGAVSEAVVVAMLRGALQKSGAQLGVAISGVAGPGGGSEEKPVGTVWLAWGSLNSMFAAAFYIPGSRERFQRWVTALALDLCRRHALGLNSEPVYVSERATVRPKQIDQENQELSNAKSK